MYILEYEEEVIKWKKIIVCLKKERNERDMMVSKLMLLGFKNLKKGNKMINSKKDSWKIYMMY